MAQLEFYTPDGGTAASGSRSVSNFHGCTVDVHPGILSIQLSALAVFLFLFFTKIYFRFGNLHKYTPAARLPGGRGLSAKKEEKLQTGPWGRSPGCGAAGPPPLYKVLAAPHHPFGLLKIQKKRKERVGGRERRGEGEAKLCRIFKPATLGN